jgi:hypothetical protein
LLSNFQPFANRKTWVSERLDQMPGLEKQGKKQDRDCRAASDILSLGVALRPLGSPSRVKIGKRILK